MPYELEGDAQARAAFRLWATALEDEKARTNYMTALDDMEKEEAAAKAQEQQAKLKREALLAQFPRAICRHRAITREDALARGQYECTTAPPVAPKSAGVQP